MQSHNIDSFNKDYWDSGLVPEFLVFRTMCDFAVNNPHIAVNSLKIAILSQ